jgi:hypothetical protein
MKEALSSSETSVISRATQRNIPEDAILLFIYNSEAEQFRWVQVLGLKVVVLYTVEAKVCPM